MIKWPLNFEQHFDRTRGKKKPLWRVCFWSCKSNKPLIPRHLKVHHRWTVWHDDLADSACLLNSAHSVTMTCITAEEFPTEIFPPNIPFSVAFFKVPFPSLPPRSQQGSSLRTTIYFPVTFYLSVTLSAFVACRKISKCSRFKKHRQWIEISVG